VKNFDEAQFLRVQSGAVGLRSSLDVAIAACLRRGADSLFFAGTGGAGILMEPAALLLNQRSTLPTFCVRPAELCLTGHRRLGSRSVVVIPSLSGTTKESLAVLDYAKSCGATTIALTGRGDCPLAVAADHRFVNAAADDTSSESFYLQSLFIALSVMKARGEGDDQDDYERVARELEGIPSMLLEVKRAFEPQAEHHACTLAAHDYHIISSAGLCWSQAHYYGMCILEEMQWIRTRPVHAADFFHGTLELVEKGVHVLLLKGEDASRPLVERVERFCGQYTDLLTIIDTGACVLSGISVAVRALLGPALLATVLERVSAHLEIIRDHPLTTRRYYKRVSY
jgi:fructoselysine-6-phosphate deglycase